MTPAAPPVKFESLAVAIHKSLTVQGLYGEDAPDRIMKQKAVYDAIRQPDAKFATQEERDAYYSKNR